ncbi:hypothetical protein PYW07_007506 [Mythimna separata]|uniref:Uncharacterized protein n=1 Tax=Mythimna separata TaxID=271217 RepID=A0AAD7Z399_MYTSE|nr:hypothetical protein PYW07_007506 [Mythimna separata]
MDDQPNHSLRPRHSYSMQASKHSAHAKNYCKSDMSIAQKQQMNDIRQRDVDVHSSFEGHGEYYKKYEHDEVPVKDSNLINVAKIRDKGSLTNSELDQLEYKIFKNMSQELQTDDDNSRSSLESNIKFFKTTVLEIFDNFYASMRDFELYKRRFNEILEKNKEDAVGDMEDFIKDMIQHIMSSETLICSDGKTANDFAALSVKDKEIFSSEGKKSDEHDASESLEDKDISNETDGGKSTDLASVSFRDKQTNVSHFDDESSYETNNSAAENIHSVIEAYRNDHYLTDSTLDDIPPKAKTDKTPPNKDEIFNIFLLSGNPCVQIKINDRNLLSEINIKEPVVEPDSGKHVASAENMQRLAAKKMELEKYVNVEQEHDSNMPDREIPVKVSYAKKNIYLNEDFSQERDTEKSFITKLCNFLCKKFRKSS